MKCKKCGAEIQKDKVYCSICGTEVQLVPDYNFLEDDMLSDIIQNGTKGTTTSSQYDKTDASDTAYPKKKKPGRKRSVCIWGTICIVILAAVLTLFFLYQDIQKKHRNSYAYQFAQGMEYQDAGDYENAVLSFKNALNLHPEDKDAEKQLLEIYMETNEEEAAVSILESWIAKDKTDRESCEKLIAIYDKNKEYNKILALCEEVKSSSMLDLFSDYLVEQPRFSNISGTYKKPLTVSISSEKGYDIFYTENGNDPVSDGNPYYAPVSLNEEGTTVLKAVTRNEKGIYSEVVTATYTISYESPDMPKVTPNGGTYAEPQMITVKVLSDCTAYYTWDGTDPTENSSVYTGPLEMPQGNHVLSVIVVNSLGLKSDIYRVNYIYMP